MHEFLSGHMFYFSWIYTQEWNSWSYGNSRLVFWGNTKLFSQVATTFYIPNLQQGVRVPISPESRQHLLLDISDDSHPNGCEVRSQCGSDLHFSGIWWSCTPFHGLIGCLYAFFGEMSIQSLLFILHWLICLFIIELYLLYDLQTFFLFCGFSFHFLDGDFWNIFNFNKVQLVILLIVLLVS